MTSNYSTSHQQLVYEQSYHQDYLDYGMPDRKIADGKDLKNARILNVGGGSSQDLWYLSGTNKVVGLDYAVSGLKFGQNHQVDGVSADLNFYPTLPFESDQFDIVVLKDILEHLIDPLTILSDVKRVLKPDGYVIVSVPNHFFSPLRLRILFGKGLIWNSGGKNHAAHDQEWNYMHIRFFTYRGFNQFIRGAGFTIEKWFLDFGHLAHYNDPDMWLEPQLWKAKNGIPLSRRGTLGVKYIWPLWKIFNLIFPRRLRAAIVSISPGLLCSGYYVRLRIA